MSVSIYFNWKYLIKNVGPEFIKIKKYPVNFIDKLLQLEGNSNVFRFKDGNGSDMIIFNTDALVFSDELFPHRLLGCIYSFFWASMLDKSSVRIVANCKIKQKCIWQYMQPIRFFSELLYRYTHIHCRYTR